jgi:hypothetical protein
VLDLVNGLLKGGTSPDPTVYRGMAVDAQTLTALLLELRETSINCVEKLLEADEDMFNHQKKEIKAGKTNCRLVPQASSNFIFEISSNGKSYTVRVLYNGETLDLSPVIASSGPINQNEGLDSKPVHSITLAKFKTLIKDKFLFADLQDHTLYCNGTDHRITISRPFLLAAVLFAISNVLVLVITTIYKTAFKKSKTKHFGRTLLVPMGQQSYDDDLSGDLDRSGFIGNGNQRGSGPGRHGQG